VNFDLESLSSAQKLNLTSFIQRAVSMIKAELPAAEISMATPAVDWSGSWDFKKLSELCDYLIVMGYDYYWSGSSTAGPVAPLAGENYNITRTVTTYLNAGVAPEKLALGVPWYGYDWPVMGEGRKSTATGKATARVYSAAQQLAETYSKIFDMSTSVPRVSYFVSSAWRQMWFEDTLSLFLKYQLVNSSNLTGIGIWALSYEGSYNEVWSTIDHTFSPAEPSYSTGIIKVYPNPAASGTKIEFSVSTSGKISLKIYDLTGRERLVLVDEVREAGSYSEDFDPRGLRQGVYLCVLKAGKITSTSKIVIINR
jgi:spore germination protein YaaH